MVSTARIVECLVLLDVISRHWGYDSFRPLQQEAMTASLEGRDSLVVMPTGGGKSLCYQAPALLKDHVTVVVSPLISLMKDQVDGLRECGVGAAQMNSSQPSDELRAVERALFRGDLRMLFVSPERLAILSFRELLQRAGVKTFAIDEAHCISHWGHDFRPEYRQLRTLREEFADASFHAYTATATEQVRRDIAQQLALRDPVILVGDFDRPNLTYRILPRREEWKQIVEIVDRHKNEAGIIYCMRRKDVDTLTAKLQRAGYGAVGYHAGLSQEERRSAQDAFASEKTDLVVATVAFGMGIDRSNVRFILHTAMPKSIEHYQQETGRAGRDGLEAECAMLYSAADAILWKSMIERPVDDVAPDPRYVATAVKHLNDIDRYCSGVVCRHRALVEYFGQTATRETCATACDICLGETEDVPDALIVAQKILSCVVRVGQSFGVGHVVSVLRGEVNDRITQRRHNELTTYGLLKDFGKNEIRDWIWQLVGQGFLEQTKDEYPVLRLTEAARPLLRGQAAVRLRQPIKKRERERRAPESLAGVDADLFEALRKWRRGEAEERGVPPYVIFSDRTLREVARARPETLHALRGIYGIGDAKLDAFGRAVLEVIASAASA
jgi:ATP-dependent DNA helicase RecQ